MEKKITKLFYRLGLESILHARVGILGKYGEKEGKPRLRRHCVYRAVRSSLNWAPNTFSRSVASDCTWRSSHQKKWSIGQRLWLLCPLSRALATFKILPLSCSYVDVYFPANITFSPRGGRNSTLPFERAVVRWIRFGVCEKLIYSRKVANAAKARYQVPVHSMFL